jgi:cytochrome c-type biogenesis protein CcmE
MDPRTQRRVVIVIAALIGLAMVLTLVVTPTL